jgi:MscS family membrane protein
MRSIIHYIRTYSAPLYSLCFMLLLMSFTQVTKPQLDPTDTATKEAEEKKEPEWPADSLNRRTPRGTVLGFLEAVAEEDYEKAALYLDLSTITKPQRDGYRLAQGLQRLLDTQGRIIPRTLISDNPEGTKDDDLSPELDIVGTATANEETFNIMVEKTEGPQGGPIWLFSDGTVERIPVIIQEEKGIQVDRLLPAFLKENKWKGSPVGHWLAMLVLLVVGYLAAWGITLLLVWLIRLLWQNARLEPISGIIKAFALPIKLYLTIWLVIAVSREIGISIILRQWFNEMAVIGSVIVFLLLMWRLIEVLTHVGERQLSRKGNFGGVSAIIFFRRGAMFALFAIGIIVVLDIVGVNVTTGLAALGIGGLALALGAQKTIENFVGSVTLIADQPIRVGDFCRVGETMGMVEQIGMRSTRIRTLDRTIVTIPNGEFSSLRIENFAHRDRYWFHPVFNVRYETTTEQIRYLLVELRSVLYAHPKVDPDPARVRFIGLAHDSLKIEVFAFVHAWDYNDFLEVQEDLLLRMMDVVRDSGTDFAFPSQTLYFGKDKGVEKEKTQGAEEKVKKWRESQELHIPHFDRKKIDELRNSILYPPEGSSSSKPQE